MNKLSLLLGTLVALSGCAGTSSTAERDWQRYYSDRAPSSTPTHSCVAKAGPSCKAKVMWSCPMGFVDGCFTPGSNGKHHCVIRNSEVACNLRVDMRCPSSFADGCENGSSKNHECLPKPGAVPCTQKATEECPANFEDSCG